MKKESNINSGLTDSETVKNVQEMFKEAETSVSSFLKTYQEFIKTISSLNKSLVQNTKNENPYELTLKEIEKEQSALDAEVKSYSDSKKRRLEIDKWLIGLKKVFCFIT